MEIVLKASAEGFAPRTRKGTSDALAALAPVLAEVQSRTPNVFTIAEQITPARAASLVSLLNDHHGDEWTFAGRSTTDGKAIVQARFSATDRRPARKPRSPNGQAKSKATVKATVKR